MNGFANSMQQGLPQLTLGFKTPDQATFDNYFSGKNNEIVAALKNTASGQGERIIYLCGSRGQGRSHLLQACCVHAFTHHRTSVYLPLANLMTQSPEILSGLESLALICIDDLHLLAGNSVWEEALFHLFNRVYDAGGSIIFTANDLPKSLRLQLPDLESRLSWGVTFQLHSLTDEEKLLALINRAFLRGITLSEEVGRYILTHCPRHMGTLFAALDALDNASLAAHRRLTIPFVKEVLEGEYLCQRLKK